MWFVLVINWTGCMSESLESKEWGPSISNSIRQNTKPWKSVINTFVCNESAWYFSLPWRFLSLCFYCSLLRQCIMTTVEKLSTGAMHRRLVPEQEAMIGWWARRLEALAVDDAGAGFIVFLLGDPHLLEGGQGGQDGAADPDGVTCAQGEQWSTEEEKIKYYLQTQSVVFKGVMNWEIKILLIFWHIRGYCTVKNILQISELKTFSLV